MLVRVCAGTQPGGTPVVAAVGKPVCGVGVTVCGTVLPELDGVGTALVLLLGVGDGVGPGVDGSAVGVGRPASARQVSAHAISSGVTAAERIREQKDRSSVETDGSSVNAPSALTVAGPDENESAAVTRTAALSSE